MKRTLLYGADDWGDDDEPGTPSPRKRNIIKYWMIQNKLMMETMEVFRK